MKSILRIKWKTVAKIIAIILCIYLCIHYWPGISELMSKIRTASAPIIVGIIVAYAVNILMSFYEKFYFPNSKKKAVIKTRRPVCMLSALITLLGIIALIIGLVAPQLIECIETLISKIPAAIDYTLPKLQKILVKLQDKGIVPDNIMDSIYSINWKARLSEFFSQERIESVVSTVTEGLGGAFNLAYGAIKTIITALINFVIGIIFAVYLLLEKDKIISQCKRLLSRIFPEEKTHKITYIWLEICDCFRDFIVGQCTEAVILGVLCTLGMLILQIPYAPMIGALMGFTALIPIVGGLIGAGIGAFLILVDGSPVKALVFIIFVIILQQIEGNIIYPKVVGQSLGLPGIWVLAAVTVGGGVMGIAGMIIGVPLTAAAYRLLKAYVNTPKPEIQKEKAETNENTDEQVQEAVQATE